MMWYEFAERMYSHARFTSAGAALALQDRRRDEGDRARMHLRALADGLRSP